MARLPRTPSAKTVTSAVTSMPGSKVGFWLPSFAMPLSRVWTPITLSVPSAKRASATGNPA